MKCYTKRQVQTYTSKEDKLKEQINLWQNESFFYKEEITIPRKQYYIANIPKAILMTLTWFECKPVIA